MNEHSKRRHRRTSTKRINRKSNSFAKTSILNQSSTKTTHLNLNPTTPFKRTQSIISTFFSLTESVCFFIPDITSDQKQSNQPSAQQIPTSWASSTYLPSDGAPPLMRNDLFSIFKICMHILISIQRHLECPEFSVLSTLTICIKNSSSQSRTHIPHLLIQLLIHHLHPRAHSDLSHPDHSHQRNWACGCQIYRYLMAQSPTCFLIGSFVC